MAPSPPILPLYHSPNEPTSGEPSHHTSNQPSPSLTPVPHNNTYTPPANPHQTKSYFPTIPASFNNTYTPSSPILHRVPTHPDSPVSYMPSSHYQSYQRPYPRHPTRPKLPSQYLPPSKTLAYSEATSRLSPNYPGPLPANPPSTYTPSSPILYRQPTNPGTPSSPLRYMPSVHYQSYNTLNPPYVPRAPPLPNYALPPYTSHAAMTYHPANSRPSSIYSRPVSANFNSTYNPVEPSTVSTSRPQTANYPYAIHQDQILPKPPKKMHLHQHAIHSLRAHKNRLFIAQCAGAIVISAIIAGVVGGVTTALNK